MKRYPERLADGRELYIETVTLGVLGQTEYTAEGAVRTGFRLDEGAAPKGTLGVIEGVFAQADIINKNRRLYSKEVYELAVGRAQNLIQAGNFLGEVDHPDFVGSLAGAAIRFTKVWMDEGLGRFEAVLLNTEPGRHLKGLIEGGVGVQISTRGYASSTVEKRTIGGVEIPIVIIGKDLTFEGIDPVLFASNPAGRVTHAKTEGAEGVVPPAAPQTEEVAPMTLAELREKYAALVADIEAAAREGYVPASEVEAKVAEATEAGKAEGQKLALESAEVTGRVTALAAILEAVTPFIPTAQQAAESKTESEAEQKAAALTAQVAELAESVKALTAEKNAAEAAKLEAEQKAAAEKAEADRKTAIAEKVEALLKDYAHADILRDTLLKAESAEAAERLFGEQSALIDAVAARKAVAGATGEGKADVQTPDAATVVSEELKRQRRIAGIEQ